MRPLLSRSAVLLGAVLLAGCAVGTDTASPTPASTPPSAASSTPARKAAEEPLIAVGAAVIANESGDSWGTGTVTAADGATVTVKFDDSDSLGTVLSADKVAQKPVKPQPAKVGDVVVAKWTTSTWWLATVTKVDGNRVEVRYSDNTTGDDLTTTDIARPLKGKLPKPPPPDEEEDSAPPQPSAPDTAAPAGTFSVGAKVLGNWGRGQAWYPGRVTAASDGTYDVTYDDGDEESDVPASALATYPTGPLDVKVGDAVVAEWQPTTWWSATVTAVDGDEVDVTYSDDTTGTLKKTQLATPGR